MNNSFEERLAELEKCPNKEKLNFEFRGSDRDSMVEAARTMGEFYKQKGILSTGECTICTKTDLVSVFVGASAGKANEMVKKATGGVLYLENLFELEKEGYGGLEALDTLLVAMSVPRKDLVIVVAGDAEEMAAFMERNKGFVSRIRSVIHFE